MLKNTCLQFPNIDIICSEKTNMDMLKSTVCTWKTWSPTLVYSLDRFWNLHVKLTQQHMQATYIKSKKQYIIHEKQKIKGL